MLVPDFEIIITKTFPAEILKLVYTTSSCGAMVSNRSRKSAISIETIAHSVNGTGWVWTDFVIQIPRAIGLGVTKCSHFTKPFERKRLVVCKRIRAQWSNSTIICICTIAYEDYIIY